MSGGDRDERPARVHATTYEERRHPPTDGDIYGVGERRVVCTCRYESEWYTIPRMQGHLGVLMSRHRAGHREP